MDCILGYHLQPFTCGIARFNHALGEKLAIPVVSLFSEAADECRHALLSIKLSEFTDKDTGRLEAFIASRDATQTIDLFLHDYADTPTEQHLIALASRIYVGNAQMARILGPRHPRVIEAWCPGTLIDAHAFPQTEISVFSFGMAHKIRAERYYRLRELLEATGKSYGIYMSTALHEGTDFAGSFMTAFEEMTEIFGQRVNFLGFLSDAAVFNYLNSCTYFTAFFPQGVRANNTSVQTAMQCGSVVISNLDADSPPEYLHGVNILDIDKLDALPTDANDLGKLGEAARRAASIYGWDPLVELIRNHAETPGN